MTLDTLDFADRYSFVGYSEEIQHLVNTLRRKDLRVLNLYGEPGVGKTAMANRILELSNSGVLAGRFEVHTRHSAHQEAWTKVLSLLGEALLERSAVLRATREEIEEGIMSHCERRKVLALIDNLEPADFNEAIPFLRKWLKAAKESTLLVTSQLSLPEFEEESSGVVRLKLTGLSDDGACLVLLGPELQERFGDTRLRACAKDLAGIPLKLLYLRWINPKDEASLSKHVDQLSKPEYEPGWLLENILHSYPHSLAFFEALGAVRQLEFDESLLAYFWDQLGAGNAETYVTIREKLIDDRLLAPVGGVARSTYRLSAVIHMQLGKILARRVQERRLPVVNFLASEFFRQTLEHSAGSSVASLDSFVYHSFESGRGKSAYEYLFREDHNIVPRVRQAGMAFHLQNTLQRFLNQEALWSPLQLCRLLIEMAHVYNDLSEYTLSLEMCSRAEAILSQLADDQDCFTKTRLRLRIWYVSAVAFSNNGKTEACALSYANIIAAAATGLREEPLTCLSLGYLAHDLKHRDIRKALGYALTAVDIAREVGDRGVLARNLTSLGEISIYARKREQAERCFREARDICTELDDRRELGRTLKNWGVHALAQHDWAEAESRLSAGRAISESVGDRRRVATADLFLGILFRQRDDAVANAKKASRLVLDAIGALLRLKDGRYLVPAVLTYASWQVSSFSGEIETIRSCHGLEAISDAVEALLAEPDFEVGYFTRFWRDYFRVALLT